MIQSLESAINKGSLKPEKESLDSKLPVSGAGFGNAEQNKKVEQRAITLVMNLLYKNGWTVDSVELKNLGYDLHCKKVLQLAMLKSKG
ncbi:MAG: hypothetical protein HC853_06615 [Anaerolineae bacterium]|nr:hypothetical protein [Anaerolineae bacterium]